MLKEKSQQWAKMKCNNSQVSFYLCYNVVFKWTGNAFNCNFREILANKKKEVHWMGNSNAPRWIFCKQKTQISRIKARKISTETLDMTITNRRIVFQIIHNSGFLHNSKRTWNSLMRCRESWMRDSDKNQVRRRNGGKLVWNWNSSILVGIPLIKRDLNLSKELHHNGTAGEAQRLGIRSNMRVETSSSIRKSKDNYLLFIPLLFSPLIDSKPVFH